MPIQSKTDLLYESLKTFYKIDENFEKFKLYTSTDTKKTNVSLRLLDYLCTKYCKTNMVLYTPENTNQRINLYNSYKDQLKAYSKIQFDPFRRHKRVMLERDNKEYETTIAQLNFFKWIIEIKLIEWLEKNDGLQLSIVENTMSSNTKRKVLKNKM